jgi:hypothetical protein
MLVLLAAGATVSSQGRSVVFPAPLENYLSSTVRPSSSERRVLYNGEPFAKLLDADASKEVAVFGAVWIDAPVRRYVEAVADIENFEKGGGFKVTRRISSPPVLADFAELRLPLEDFRDLRTCRVGDCQLKLGEKALQAIRNEVNWNAPDAHQVAESVMRRLALEYVTGYLEGGNERLAVYRDKTPPLLVAEELAALVNGMPSLTKDVPAVRKYLLEYPRAQLPDATSFLYWQETDFGLKPTIRINHVTMSEMADSTVVASKMLYASHYFWAALELRVLLPDAARGRGFWLVTISRSRSDGLSGFTGLFVRRRVRSEALKGVQAVLVATKNRLQKSLEPRRP